MKKNLMNNKESKNENKKRKETTKKVLSYKLLDFRNHKELRRWLNSIGNCE